MTKTREDIAMEVLVEMISESYFRIFNYLSSEDLITENLKNDFAIFHDTVIDTVAKMGITFSMQKVYKKLPNNVWVPVYKKALIGLNKNSINTKTVQENVSSIVSSERFQQTFERSSAVHKGDLSAVN